MSHGKQRFNPRCGRATHRRQHLLVEPVRHHADAVDVDVSKWGVTELWNEVSGDFALVGANSSYSPHLAAAVEFGSDHLHPSRRVLFEAHRPRLLRSSLSTITRRSRCRWLPLPNRDLGMHRSEPGTRIRLVEERQRLVVIGSSRVHLSVWPGIARLPTAGRELAKAAPRLSLRCAHYALPWTRTDSHGLACRSVPLDVYERWYPLDSADTERSLESVVARSGTASAVCRPQISGSRPPRFHVEDARVPSTCQRERIFMVISVLLCHFEEGTKKARTREISQIRAFDQAFQPGLQRVTLRSPSHHPRY